jgi:protein-tyrosine kinase
VSLVERALQKMQASDRARKQGQQEAPVSVGHVVTVAQPIVPVRPKTRPVVNTNRLVKVDQDALRACGLLPAPEQERELADQYRAIKRPLIQAAFHSPVEEGPSPQLIMIGSALPGDGKTFTGINLAFSMAREKDHSVLLVDGDVAKPHVSKLFGVDREPGLLDVLVNPDLDIRSVILPTDVPGLSILPAGTQSETATELLASDRMAQIVEQLATLDPSGIVLFDSLPILLTSESRVLAGLMGQIVLVVKAGETPQQAVTDALEAIGPDKKVSLVLNQAVLSGPLGYYYGYRYGYQQADANVDSEAARQ